MGVPFSKEVEIVLNSVQDLKPVAATVLQTVRYAAPLLLLLQIAIMFLAAVIALIITVDPNLVEEREALVTPVLKWLVRGLLWRRAWAVVAGPERESEGEPRRLARDVRSGRLRTVSLKEN